MARVCVHRPRRRSCSNEIHLVGSECELRSDDAALLRQAAAVD